MCKHNDDDDNVDVDDDDDEDGKNDDDNNDYVYFENEENGTDVIHHSELSKEMKIATLMPVMASAVLILYNFIFHRRSLKSLSEWRHFRTAST